MLYVLVTVRTARLMAFKVANVALNKRSLSHTHGMGGKSMRSMPLKAEAKNRHPGSGLCQGGICRVARRQ